MGRGAPRSGGDRGSAPTHLGPEGGPAGKGGGVMGDPKKRMDLEKSY